ncbi:MAG: TIM barrel protein [Caldilineaceae bacterium]
MLKNVPIGCGQITWRGLDEKAALADIAASGYAGAPAGPSQERTPAQTLALYESYGLRPAPGYFAADFWKAEQEAEILERARVFAAASAELGLTEMYVATGGFDRDVMASGRTRAAASGHVTPADGLNAADFGHFAATLNRVGEITLAEGVKSCFHNHVGSVIETGEEMDRLLAATDPEVVFLGPDTGHLAWAGADVLGFFRRYADRIKTAHVKDIDEAVRQEGVAKKWDYRTFSEHGIWAEVGHGVIDFPAVFQILADAGFDGWIIVETDVTQLASPLESARVSRAYLRGLGL